MQGYWQTELPREVKAAVLADWADTLEDWPIDQIQWALTEWRNDNPSKRPNPGHVLQLLKKRRGEEWAKQAPKQAPDPQPIRADAETRAQQAAMVAHLFPITNRIQEVKE